jgi:hypothetical protein
VTAPNKTDPLLRHSRREAIIIAISWLAATVYCCTYSYLFGYIREGHPLSVGDVKPILGIPNWVFWGYFVPWGVCAVFNIWFAGFYVADDDLGRDHTVELESDIRAGGSDD